jgi:hypothetical protein
MNPTDADLELTATSLFILQRRRIVPPLPATGPLGAAIAEAVSESVWPPVLLRAGQILTWLVLAGMVISPWVLLLTG